MEAGLREDIAPRRGSKRRLVTARDVDGRYRGARRARKIARELIGAFGPGITAAQRQAAERAAMLCALSEDLAARRMAGEPVSIDEMIRLEGAARRAVARLDLPKAERPERNGPLTLADLQGIK